MKHAPLKFAALALATTFFAGTASAMPLAPASQKPLGYGPFNGVVEPAHYTGWRRRYTYYPRYRYRYAYRPYYYSYGLTSPYYNPYYRSYGYPYYGYRYPYSYGFGPSFGFGFRID